jgi:hypothetical protein
MPANSILFILPDGVYTFAHTKAALQKAKTLVQERPSTVPADRHRMVAVGSLLDQSVHIRKQQQALVTVRAEIQTGKTKIADVIDSQQAAWKVLKQTTSTLANIDKLAQLVADEEALLGKEAALAEKIKTELLTRSKTVQSKMQEFQAAGSDLKAAQTALVHLSDTELPKTRHMLNIRRRKLMYGLLNVYPIRAPNKTKKRKFFTIRSAPLPITNLTSYDEEVISTALGYVAHMVFLLAKYVPVKLRYKIIFQGSRSMICDEYNFARQKNSEDATFPLYYRNVDEKRFEFACVLLNKNIDQLGLVCVPDWTEKISNRTAMLSNLHLLLSHQVQLVEKQASKSMRASLRISQQSLRQASRGSATPV